MLENRKIKHRSFFISVWWLCQWALREVRTENSYRKIINILWFVINSTRVLKCHFKYLHLYQSTTAADGRKIVFSFKTSKVYTRSSMSEDRLNGLVILNTRKDVPVNVDEGITRFSDKSLDQCKWKTGSQTK